MNRWDQEWMANAFPRRTERFDAAIDAALAQVRVQTDRAAASGRRGRPLRRPMLAWALAACLLLAGTLGVAEGARRGVFDFIWGERDVLPEATKLAHAGGASLTLGGTELTVTESACDGATLRLVLSVRCAEIGERLTHAQLEDGESAFNRALARDHVSAMYSFDWFTLNGEEIGMTGGSGGETVPGEQSGEALMYFELNLTEIDVPEGDIEIGLPVGSNAQGERVMLTVLAQEPTLDSVRDVTPRETFAIGEGTLTVVSARLSPMGAYATVRVDFPEGAGAEAADAILAWQRFTFVDAQGNEACPYTALESWGLPLGEEDAALHFEASIRCKPAESYPDALYLAPVGADGANMDAAVLLAR